MASGNLSSSFPVPDVGAPEFDSDIEFQHGVISAPESQDGEDDHNDKLEDGPHSPNTMSAKAARKSAFYDYKQEKEYQDTDAKLFYQQQQTAQAQGQSPFHAATGSGGSLYASPLMRPQGLATLSRTASLKSFGSAHHHHLQLQQQSHSGAYPSRSSIPSGLANFDKPAQSEEIQFPEGMDGSDPHHAIPERSHNAPSYHTESAEAASGVTGIHFEGFGSRDATISSELSAIYTNIQRILDIRHKYIRVSLQGPTDNPKDEPSWKIYPAPPPPQWVEERETNSISNSQIIGLDVNQTPTTNQDQTSYKPGRKPGMDVGADFHFEECEIPSESEMEFKLDEQGVYQVYENKTALDVDIPVVQVPTIKDYYLDLDQILDISSDGPSKSFAFRRLQYLEGKCNLYILLNEYQEMADTKRVPHRDFYNVRKVDTHVHHSACMNQKHLLRFIKSKMKKCPDEVVLYRDRKYLTLAEVFASISLTAYDLSIDTLDMHAHTDSFHRFDKFNLKYNPVGESRLRTIFLKTDNYIEGRYLAEITREVLTDLESSKYQMAEYRISIYGRSANEWDRLAAWIIDNKLFSHNVRWLIQVPRLYDVYKDSGLVNSFEEIVKNIFKPLFEVTKDPSSHPKLHVFLQRVVGFDSVDDESKAERRLYKKFPLPKAWDTKQNPPYSYWIYYLFANMASLNVFRKQRGFNTFVLRPHCGEAGDTDHLAAAVLCCHSISHGILLRKVPMLQYIFYLEQIGIAMSPLSNNALFLAYDKNPFLAYFKRGLNVSLSTDDPLQFAFTKEPLIEEYAVAAQIYKLSAVDMCELARNSVLQSGFESGIKARWLGDTCMLKGVSGNNMDKSNVPNIRVAFRHQTLMEELAMIDRYTSITTAQSYKQNQGQLLELFAQNRGSLGPTTGPPSPTTSMYTNPTTNIPSIYQQALNTPTFNTINPPRGMPPHQHNEASSMSAFANLGEVPSSPQPFIIGGGRGGRSVGGTPTHMHAYEPSDRPFPPPRSATINLSALEHGVREIHAPLDGSEPRIFPGVITHSTTRRASTKKQRSWSEKDSPGTAEGTRPGTRQESERDEKSQAATPADS